MKNNIATPQRNCISDIEFISRINVAMSSVANLTNNMSNILRMIGEHERNDRVEIINVRPDMSFSIVHEWYHPTVAGHPEIKMKFPYLFEKRLQKQLNEENYILIDDPESLTNESLKSYLKELKAKHVALIPLFIGNAFAFLAFCHCKEQEIWDKRDLHVMTLLSSTIAANLEKSRVMNRLINHVYQNNYKSSNIQVAKV